MRSIRVVLLATWGVLALAAVPNAAEQEESDQVRLPGVWHGYVVEGSGENPDRGVYKLAITIKDGQMSATSKEGAEDLGAGTFTLNLESDPKTLDATRKKANGQGETHEGIYALEGDTLKWCVTNGRNKKRPTEFLTKPGAGQFLLVLRRQVKK